MREFAKTHGSFFFSFFKCFAFRVSTHETQQHLEMLSMKIGIRRIAARHYQLTFYKVRRCEKILIKHECAGAVSASRDTVLRYMATFTDAERDLEIFRIAGLVGHVHSTDMNGETGSKFGHGNLRVSWHILDF